MFSKQPISKPLWLAVTLGSVLWIPCPGLQAAVFDPPEGSAPSRAAGGASRSTFMPPGDSGAPSRAAGGASRSTFMPPGDSGAPSRAAGGASRSTFMPPGDSGAPSRAAGGASRSTFTPPSDSSAPDRTAGGASREAFLPPQDGGSLGQTASGASREAFPLAAMSALLPESFYGTTLASHPTILVYLPPSSPRTALFSLKDEAGNLVYQTSMPVSGQAGIVMMEIPESAPALEVGKDYQWYFALAQDGQLSTNSPFVEGWIRRITPSSELSEALAGKTPVQQASVLAAQGVWYDCASILAKLRAGDPTNAALISEWTELLDSVQLSPLTAVPLISGT